MPLLPAPIERDELARRYIATEAKVQADPYRRYRDVYFALKPTFATG